MKLPMERHLCPSCPSF